MTADTEIGHVVSVDTAQVSIELNRDIKGMVRNSYEDAQEVGRINSYVILPVSGQRLVAIVTRVVLAEDAEFKADRKAVTLPVARRLMKATLVGAISGSVFRQGVSIFPILDNAVHMASRKDLEAIFGLTEKIYSEESHKQRLRYCISIGEYAAISGQDIRIDPDSFFGKHAAIIGSTGSGKSCTIATLLQSIREKKDVKRTTCIILDTNGEYRAAFQQRTESNTWEDHGPRRTLYIPSGRDSSSDRLAIPYWFMNSEDIVRMFQASKGVQAPVLLEGLRLARNDSVDVSPFSNLRDEIMHEINRIDALAAQDTPTSRDVRELTKGLIAYIQTPDLDAAWSEDSRIGLSKHHVISALKSIETEAGKHVGRNEFSNRVPINSRKHIQSKIQLVRGKLQGMHPRDRTRAMGSSADIPSYFDMLKLRSHHIERVLGHKESGGPKSREFCGTMLLRIDRLLADPRFEFLFGPIDHGLTRPMSVLAAFIRDILGIGASGKNELSDCEDVPIAHLPFYDRQRNGQPPADVVILDLSLVATEVLENVTTLIGRIILEFLQRFGEHDGDQARGSLPVILVLEEAQNYIHQPRVAGEESIARDVFERIAREGRKYGLSLVVASQRPSELSKTVLSQCNSFIVHRLQNPEDLRYFKEIVPSIYGPMLEQIPSLPPQTALVLGECVSAPVLVRLRDANPTPKSHDPQFYRHWTADVPEHIDVEAICREWEGDEGADGSRRDDTSGITSPSNFPVRGRDPMDPEPGP